MVLVLRAARSERTGTYRPLWLGAAWPALPATPLCLSEFLGLPATIYFAIFVVLVALVSAVPALVLLLPRATRAGAVSWILGSVGACATAALFAFASVFVREAGFRALAVRSKPLVAALNGYVAERGAAPATLDELVPLHLPEVPGTGMPFCPEFEYSVLESGMWQLLVPCSIGLLNWDVFVYWPTQDYPRSMHGGWVEELKGWAYVHE